MPHDAASVDMKTGCHAASIAGTRRIARLHRSHASAKQIGTRQLRGCPAVCAWLGWCRTCDDGLAQCSGALEREAEQDVEQRHEKSPATNAHGICQRANLQ